LLDDINITPRSDREGSYTPRPLRLVGDEINNTGAKSQQNSPKEKEAESIASAAEDDHHGDGSLVLVVYVTDAATGIADSLGLSRAHLAAFGLGELLGVGMETPWSQHVLAAQLLEVLGANDAPGSGAGPLVVTTQEISSSSSSSPSQRATASNAASSAPGPMMVAQGAPRGFTPGVPPGSPALNLGPFRGRSEEQDGASDNVFWLRGVQLPVANNFNNSSTTSSAAVASDWANANTSSSSGIRNAMAFTGSALPLMLAMRLDPTQHKATS